MHQPRLGFHFQPFSDQELIQTDNAPLLFNSQPPGRNGRTTVFMKTRRTLRRRLGVHDLGQIDGMFQDSERDIHHGEMKQALGKMTQWRYLFPPEMKGDITTAEPIDCKEFRSVVERVMGRTG